MNGKYKFLAAVIGLFLLPFLIISGHFVYGNTALRKNDMLRYFEMRTLAGARIIANEMNANYNLSRLTGDKKFREAGAAGRRSVMEQRTKEMPFIYSELALVTAAGREVCRVSAGRDGKPAIDYAKSRVFEEAAKTAAPAGAVEYGEYTPPALILAQPVETAGGKPGYYLAGRLSLAYLGEVIRLLGKNSLGNFGLLDGGGQVIADSMNMSTVRPGIQAPREILTLVAAAQERAIQNFTREVFFKRRASLVSVSNVPGTKWWVYEIMDTGDIPSKGFSSARRVVLSGVLLIVIFGFAAYSLALRWLVPGREAAEGGPDEK
ncbi:MAG: cache domain-containing protein [Elusimicrobia bacterium]|nr:cache domain-containing protein [Elusimicrobiota bacterium]